MQGVSMSAPRRISLFVIVKEMWWFLLLETVYIAFMVLAALGIITVRIGVHLP
jgi:hypothetical protein